MNTSTKIRPTKFMPIISIFGFVAVSGLVNAHHSAVAFDLDKPLVQSSGKVISFIWRSPHTSINLEVTNEAGEKEIWKWEGAGTVALVRSGVTRETIKPGQTLSVTGNPVRDASPGGLMRSIQLDDGRVIDFGQAATQ